MHRLSAVMISTRSFSPPPFSELLVHRIPILLFGGKTYSLPSSTTAGGFTLADLRCFQTRKLALMGGQSLRLV